MLTLRMGDRLPTVGVIQSFLNQHDYCAGAIAVDGIFGRQTKGAVANFQINQGAPATGVLSGSGWNSIVGREWQVIDSVDLTEFDNDDHAIHDDEDFQPYRQTVIRNYGQTSGTPQLIQQILTRSYLGKVALLRFHGHGGPGNMIVASGREGNRGSSLNSRYGPRFFQAMAELRPIFAPFGSVEMHGCRVAAGVKGRDLLEGMSSALNVPVSAGLRTQLGGGDSSFRFEGRVVTCCPSSIALKTWAQRQCQTSYSPGSALMPT